MEQPWAAAEPNLTLIRPMLPFGVSYKFLGQQTAAQRRLATVVVPDFKLARARNSIGARESQVRLVRRSLDRSSRTTIGQAQGEEEERRRRSEMVHSGEMSLASGLVGRPLVLLLLAAAAASAAPQLIARREQASGAGNG